MSPLPTTRASITATNTVRYKVLLTAGVGSLPTITRTATSTLLNGTNWVVQGAYSASATFSATTGSTVDLDDVEMKFCWSDPTSATSGVSFARTSFVDGKNLAVRNSLIALAIALFPFYALWIGCGAIADRMEKKRVRTTLARSPPS